MGLRERISSGIRGRAKPASDPAAQEKRLAERERRMARADRPRRPAISAAGGSQALRSVAIEVLKLVREMLIIPAQLWMALAEVAGAIVLRAWLAAVRPLLIMLWAVTRVAYRLALRHVTPARATAVVALAAIVALAVSQWLDYRAVSVGTSDYAGGFDAVAPPPEVAHQQAGDAHAWVMLPIAAFAFVALAGSIAGRPRLARLLILAGAAAILISLANDAPKGLDEGSTAVAYESAEAHLLDGFWLQIVTGSVLIVCGAILPGYLSAQTARTPVRRGGRRRLLSRAAGLRRRAAGRPVEGARP